MINFVSMGNLGNLGNLKNPNKNSAIAFGLSKKDNNERPIHRQAATSDEFVPSTKQKTNLGEWGDDEDEEVSEKKAKQIETWDDIDEVPEEKEPPKSKKPLTWDSSGSVRKKQAKSNDSLMVKAAGITSLLTVGALCTSLAGKFVGKESQAYTPSLDEAPKTEQVQTQIRNFDNEAETPPKFQGTQQYLEQRQPHQTIQKNDTRYNELAGMKVVIDPGHGGKDFGAVDNGLREKDIALEVSKEVKQTLEDHKINVQLTRDADYLNNFPTYIDKYKDNHDSFISIHANSTDDKSVCGLEIYAESSNESYKLANTIYKNIKKELGVEFESHCSNWDRGVKAASTSRAKYIRRAGESTVLVETAFISNKEDTKVFTDPQLKAKLVKAIARGTEEYLAQQ
ncbi:MAG: N-acetylmuramoyl-L-alanine amidase [bacterium]